VKIELGKLGFHIGLTGPILKEDWILYALKNATSCSSCCVRTKSLRAPRRRLSGDCTKRCPSASLVVTPFSNLAPTIGSAATASQIARRPPPASHIVIYRAVLPQENPS
jgi:hypothetical protein